MNHWENMLKRVGKRLILAISIILFFTVLSVYVSTVSISKISASQEMLANNSIPALIDVGRLSRVAVNIIKQSQLMITANSLIKLNKEMDETSLSIKKLLSYLDKIKIYGLSDKLIAEIESILVILNKNMVDLYQLSSKKLKYKEDLDVKTDTMRTSIETIADRAMLMKIDVDYKFLNKINNIENNEGKSIEEILHEGINNIYFISSVIMSSGELRKDLNAIDQSINNESVLFIQQEFNHSLRKIIRSIVQSKNIIFHEDVRKNIATLIEFGQDSPDIFDDRKAIIYINEKQEMIAQENIIHTQQLNNAVFSLSNEVGITAESASVKLQDTIFASRDILYVIALVALFVSLMISWQFIYKRIVTKLAELSSITKKLSNNNFDFKINTKGDDELSEIAVALESLRDHSLKRISLNKALENKSLTLKQSNEDLSQFAYIASHDLQEPLRMVGSYVQLLKNRYAGQLDSDADIYINYAVDGCVRMKALIEGILEYSRIESNDEELQDINCNYLINEVIQDLSIHIIERNAEIIVDEMPDIYAAPSQVRVIFSNLISNALKYCEQQIPRVEIQSSLLGDKIRFSIKDNGIGIKPQYQQKIFVIFKRLHSRAEYSGTGIGLSICKKIIERNGGKISLDSELGVGTTFFFTLPVSCSTVDTAEHKIAV